MSYICFHYAILMVIYIMHIVKRLKSENVFLIIKLSVYSILT